MSLKRCIFIIDFFVTAALDFTMIGRQLHEGFSFLSSMDSLDQPLVQRLTLLIFVPMRTLLRAKTFQVGWC